MNRLVRRIAGAGDEGSALVIALAFLTVFSIIVAVLLTFTDTSFRTTQAVRDQGDAAFAADGAVDGAINHIRANAAWGVDPALTGNTNTCPTYTTEVNGKSVTVACQGVPGSGGTTTSGGPNPHNTPEYALLTLGTAGTDGINQTGSGKDLIVDGRTHSNEEINVTNPSARLVVKGEATSRLACNGTVAEESPGNGTASCSNGQTVADPGVGNPDYDPLQTTGFVNRSVPACNSGTPVVFQPGRYTNAVQLSNLVNGCNKLFHFTPGVYYFEFPSGNPTWNINNGNANARIIGGTLNAAGDSCDPTAANGVQWIFGGPSRVNVQAMQTLDLCATPSLTRQQIVIYGVRASTGSLVAQSLGTAPLLLTNGNNTNVRLRGLVYAPLSIFNITPPNDSEQIFGYGLIIRSLLFQLPSSTQNTSLIYAPPITSTTVTADRAVVFTASVDGRERLRAKVVFDDDTSSHNPSVQSWSALR